ncbi:hypothetical protein EVAR_65034_1 [Eumeta japonica]|uniref:Uncharacterized protein n=1 Tax=Eumeta variegata TaxID=151549 RepID=A0A4C1YQS1_EUMVA|nr:hypothetical protein EVAR_65034_1 [Eumeta japonica]
MTDIGKKETKQKLEKTLMHSVDEDKRNMKMLLVSGNHRVGTVQSSSEEKKKGRKEAVILLFNLCFMSGGGLTFISRKMNAPIGFSLKFQTFRGHEKYKSRMLKGTKIIRSTKYLKVNNTAYNSITSVFNFDVDTKFDESYHYDRTPES